jgi:monothiol glutaredoxin
VRLFKLCGLTVKKIWYAKSNNSGLNEYKSINVLENPIIREQVRIFSKWPTYPQLYIDGQLIGGSDILHEMHKDQSLQKLLDEKGII